MSAARHHNVILVIENAVHVNVRHLTRHSQTSPAALPGASANALTKLVICEFSIRVLTPSMICQGVLAVCLELVDMRKMHMLGLRAHGIRYVVTNDSEIGSVKPWSHATRRE